MPLQLIYTNAPLLLDGGRSGFGTVARSRSLPPAFVRQLERISQAPGADAPEAPDTAYSYRLMEMDGRQCHVLTRIVSGGVGLHGGTRYLAHHLVCLPREVELLQNHPARPTPAGLILALSAANFWKDQWTDAPAWLPDEFSFSSRYLPDPSQQATWKDLTGHKSNADRPNEAPYNEGCFLIVPDSCDPSTKLMLAHETDWLTLTHGWGRTFTTHFSPADNPDSFSRVFICESSANAPLVNQHKRPALHLTEDQVSESGQDSAGGIPIPEPAPTESETPPRTISVPPTAPAAGDETLIERPHLPFRVRKRRRSLRLSTAIVCLLVLIAGVSGAKFIFSPQKASHGGAHPRPSAPLSQPTDLPPRKEETISPAVEPKEEEELTEKETDALSWTSNSELIKDLTQKETDAATAHERELQHSEEIQTSPAPVPNPPPAAEKQNAATPPPLSSVSDFALLSDDEMPAELAWLLQQGTDALNRANVDWIDLSTGQLASRLRSALNGTLRAVQQDQAFRFELDNGGEKTPLFVLRVAGGALSSVQSPDGTALALCLTAAGEKGELEAVRYAIFPKVSVPLISGSLPSLPEPDAVSRGREWTPARQTRKGRFLFSVGQVFPGDISARAFTQTSARQLVLPVFPDRNSASPHAILSNELELPEGWTAQRQEGTADVHLDRFDLKRAASADLTPQAKEVVENVLNKKLQDKEDGPSASLAYLYGTIWRIHENKDEAALSEYLDLFRNRDGKTLKYLMTLLEEKPNSPARVTLEPRAAGSRISRNRVAEELRKPAVTERMLKLLREDIQERLVRRVRGMAPGSVKCAQALDLQEIRFESNRLIWVFTPREEK